MIMAKHREAAIARCPVRGEQDGRIKLEGTVAIMSDIGRRLRDFDHRGSAEEQPANLLVRMAISVIEDLIERRP